MGLKYKQVINANWYELEEREESLCKDMYVPKD